MSSQNDRWGIPAVEFSKSTWLDAEKKRKEDRQKAKEAFSFDTWKAGLEASTSSQAFLLQFENIIGLENPELREYLFGEGGIVDQVFEGKVKLSEDEYDMSIYSDRGDNADTFIGWFYTILGREILEAEKEGTLTSDTLTNFVQHVTQKYKERFEISQENKEYSLEHAIIGKTNEKFGTPENWQKFQEDKEARFTDDSWKELEEVSLDSYNRRYIQDFDYEYALFLARTLFDVCAKRKLGETIPSLFDIACCVPAGALNREAAQAFNKIGAHQAAEFLLQKVRDKGSSLREKNVASRLLYLIEMGQISVDGGMLEYLSKKYNLKGEKRGEIENAIRITSDGKLGLFDKENKLIAYVEFGDFEDQAEVEAQMMEISTELLLSRQDVFVEEQNDIEQDKESFLQDYHKIFFEDFIAAETSVRVNNLTLREQFWFYRFLKHHEDEETKTRVVEGAKKIGESFIKTFIGLQFDPEAGQRILKIAEQYEAIQCRKIFDTFSNLVGAAENIDSELAKFFVEDLSCLENNKFSDGIIERASDLLKNFVFDIDDETAEQKLTEKIVRIQTDLIVFGTLFKSAVQGKHIVEFSEIRGMDFQMKRPSEVTSKEKDQMLELYRESYKNNAALQAELVEGFENILENFTNTRLYILKHNGKIIGFDRFDKRKDGTVYFGSFNVDEDYQGSSLGRVIMEKTVEKEAKQNIIFADCEASSFIARSYIESGFVAKRFYDYKGNPSLEIVRDDSRNHEYKYKNTKKEEIISAFDLSEDGILDLGETVIARSDASLTHIPFSLLQDYVLTRYFSFGGKIYAVFERPLAELEDMKEELALHAA